MTAASSLILYTHTHAHTHTHTHTHSVRSVCVQEVMKYPQLSSSFFPPSVSLSPPAPLCHLIGSETHTHTSTHTQTHTHTQHFASTGVMSAGAQHGAACCYGDRQVPSDQQLLTCSYHLSFISFSSPLLSSPHLLTTSLFSFPHFNHSLSGCNDSSTTSMNRFIFLRSNYINLCSASWPSRQRISIKNRLKR